MPTRFINALNGPIVADDLQSALDRNRTWQVGANHMKKWWAVYTAMCTQLTDSSPAGYKHQHMHGVLHQSDEADQALTNYSEQHRRVCGASRTKDLTDSQKRGESLQFQKVFDFFKREEVETEGAFLISRLKKFSLEDTSGKKIQSQVFYIETELNLFSIHAFLLRE